MSKTVSVDIVADFVCPWCWLGKRNWDAALKQVPDIKVETTWRPYQLDPTIAREGRPYRDYMKAKFSGEHAERWKQMREYLEAAAPDAGIEFRFDDIKTRPNTLEAFFRRTEDIGDPAVLAACAEATGLERPIIEDLLSSDRDEKAVWDEEMFYRKLGVSGVPTYIFNGQFAVSGAQEPAALADAIREALKNPVEEEEVSQ